MVDMEVRELFQVPLLVYPPSETTSLCFFTMYTKLAGPRPPGDSPADGPHLIKEHWDYRWTHIHPILGGFQGLELRSFSSLSHQQTQPLLFPKALSLGTWYFLQTSKPTVVFFPSLSVYLLFASLHTHLLSTSTSVLQPVLHLPLYLPSPAEHLHSGSLTTPHLTDVSPQKVAVSSPRGLKLTRASV